KSLGLVLEVRENKLESIAGIICQPDGKVIKVHPEAPAYQQIMVGDTIHSQRLVAELISLNIIRHGRNLSLQIPAYSKPFFHDYRVIDIYANSKRERWLNH